MKGHTRIELKDVNTGKVQVIDEDNMVTAGLQKMLQPYAFSTNNFAAVNNIIGNALGGLLLFEDAIEEDIDNYLPPAGNKMTGRGVYNKTYSGDVVELGSFNVTESGLQDDGSVKLVWDFNTSQANGKISCVSLTSLLGGNLGLGDSVYETINTLPMHNLAYIDFSFSYLNLSYVSYDENFLLNEKIPSENFAPDTGVLCFTKTRFPISNVSIFDRCKYLDNNGNSGHIKLEFSHEIEEIEFTLPQKILDTIQTGSNRYYRGGNVKYIADGKMRYVFANYNSDLAANGIFYLCLLDVNNKTIEVKDIVNKTNASLDLNGKRLCSKSYSYSFLNAERIAVTSQYIFCLGKKNDTWKLFRININDNSDVVELDYTYTSNILNNDFIFFFISDEKIIFKDNVCGYIIDVQSCAVSKYDYYNLYNSSGYLKFFYQTKGNKFMLIGLGSYKTANTGYLYQYPVPIHTINNLTEPVTKTSAHTMKVTYTLSEA